MVEMEVVGVHVEQPSNTPIVLLREKEGRRRTLPIFIGGPEATAIAFALDGVVTPRPMTHDLMKDLLEALGARLDRVVITDLNEGTFFAELHLSAAGGLRSVSSRPSDAIALAIRTQTPVYVAEPVLDEAASVVEPALDESDERESEEVVEQFREFIDKISPEDFGA